MIFITGASGRLGREVAKLLPKAIPVNIEKTGMRNEIVSSFSQVHLNKLFKDATTVVHLAGSLNFDDPKQLWETNVELTKRIVKALPPSARIVFSSSISVYGKKLSQLPANEATSCNPDSPYAKSKYQAEKIVAAHKNHVILRLGTLYGKQFGDYYKILQRIEQNKLSILGNGKNLITFLHVTNAARTIVAALKSKPGLYLVTGESLPQKKLYSIAAQALGVQPPQKHVPLSLAFLFYRLHAFSLSIFGKKPSISLEHLRILSSNRVFNYNKAKKQLGFSPRSLRQGIQEMVEHYKRQR